MHSAKANRDFTRNGREQSGFSVLEMILASAILMVGIVSVVQLVPASLNSSAGNRLDTMATVVCQRELDQMLSLPLNVDSFQDKDGQTISLGGAGAPGALVMKTGDFTAIHWGGTPPPGFYKFYTDPNNPTGPSFELRWAVFPLPGNGAPVVGRRIVIGCRRADSGGQLFLPVNLDSLVQK